ncbi:MAG: hypothetical protein NkDv07_0582 [Candidatus Improbicoccus devescovinae]|nr:MAG: hypothetical protein NkDv07_0582 [Candidatus Improbicoccus devescovinae]
MKKLIKKILLYSGLTLVVIVVCFFSLAKYFIFKNGATTEVQSEHFIILYNLQDEKTALDLQKTLENNYVRITTNLKQEPSKHIRVKIYPNSQLFNEGIKSELKWYDAPDWLSSACGNNIILLLSPSSLGYNKNHDPRIGAVHEFVNILVRQIRSDIVWPLWEGIAQHEVGQAYYPLKEKHLPNSIKEMFSWTLDDGERLYSCGHSFVSFIIKNYGYDKFIELYKKDYSNNKFDKETKEIYEKWISELKHEFLKK